MWQNNESPNVATQKLTPMKKIIGYKLLKPEYEIASAKILHQTLDRLYGLVGSENDIEKLKKAGVLDLWFEPVYEEEKKIIKVSHSNGVLEVEIRDERAYCLSNSWTKSELQAIVETILPANGKFYPESFTAGCNGQYKNISREDIQKVIDAL